MADQNLLNNILSALQDTFVSGPAWAGEQVSAGIQNRLDGTQPWLYTAPPSEDLAAQQSTLDMIQRMYPSVAPGSLTPQLSSNGWFSSTPNQDVINQVLEAITASKKLDATSKGAVAKAGGATNAIADAHTGSASLSDMLAAQLAKRSQASNVYSAVGNDISYIDKNAAGTPSQPSYGNMSPANLLPQQDPQTEASMARARIMKNLFGEDVPPIPRPNPTYSQDDYINALRQRQLQQMYQQLALPQGRGQQPYLPPQLQQALELAAWRQRGGN
jgi:hypothetical protein